VTRRGTNNIVHWSEFDRGGHFAALKQPDLPVADLRAFSLALFVALIDYTGLSETTVIIPLTAVFATAG
jgi:hypothetical protein